MSTVSGDSPIRSDTKPIFSSPTKKTKIEMAGAVTIVALAMAARTKKGKQIDKGFVVNVLQPVGRSVGNRLMSKKSFSVLEPKTRRSEHWALDAARRNKLPKDFRTSKEYSNMFKPMQEELQEIETQLIKKAARRVFYKTYIKDTPKAFGFLKLATAIAATGVIIYAGGESEKATTAHLKRAINKPVKGLKEEGVELEQTHNEQLYEEDIRMHPYLEPLERLIEELPLDERAEVREASKMIKKNMDDSRKEVEGQFEDVIKNLKTLREHNIDSDEAMTDKEFVSRAASIMTGFSMAISFGNIKIANLALQKLLEIGFPKAIVKKMTKELAKLSVSEGVRSSTTGYVTMNVVRDTLGETLKHVQLPSVDESSLSEEGQKVSQGCANMILGLVSKFLSIGTKSKVRAEAIEQTSRVVTRREKEKSEIVEQHMTVAEVEKRVEAEFAPLRGRVDEVAAYVQKYSAQSDKRVDEAARLFLHVKTRVDEVRKEKMPKQSKLGDFYKKLSQIPGVFNVFHMDSGKKP
ncbi:MAG: hypothetical protein H0W88_10760 [Parachlamydiaceae bacterium]|nr:hypothetical protein [Parachlamydiaceae bacterium]